MKSVIVPQIAAGIARTDVRRPKSAGRLLLAFFSLICPSLSRAATTGTISGTLKDPSGAVIPGATITVTNTAQGVQDKTKTDDKGVYPFPRLQVGRYSLQAEAQGFKTVKRNELAVDLDSALQIDLPMEMVEK